MRNRVNCVKYYGTEGVLFTTNGCNMHENIHGKSQKNAYNKCRKYAEHPSPPTNPPHSPLKSHKSRNREGLTKAKIMMRGYIWENGSRILLQHNQHTQS